VPAPGLVTVLAEEPVDLGDLRGEAVFVET
jgi:hypothetical protein